MPAWLTAGRVCLVDAAVLLVGTAALVLRFLEFHGVMTPAAAPTLAQLSAALPHAPPVGEAFGWWSYWDQSLYLEAALAWSQANLDATLHWYPPGYALLAAPFARLVPSDPFMLPNLACLVASMWLFAAISGHLFGRALLGRSLGATIFLATTALPKRVVVAWVMPWTTTPAAVCLLICLLGTLRFTRRRTVGNAALAGFGAALGLAFRPGDAAVVGAVCAVACCAALLRGWPGWARAGRIAATALLAAAVPIVVFGTAYLAINGPHADGYLSTSAAYGYEWRLLPLRWVTVVIDPKPLFVDGQGLAQAFPWLVPGLAGLLACVTARVSPVPRLMHGTVLAAVMLDTLQFVCYRDLHPDFLWQNGIYHYFKWTLPFFGLYSALLLRALLFGPRIVPALSAVATVLALFMWRVGVTGATPLDRPLDPQEAVLPRGLSDLRDVMVARTAPHQTVLAPFGSTIRTGQAVFHSTTDFKLTPWSETIMLQPLRPMPAAASTLTLLAGYYTLDPAVAPVLARTTLSWGVPCWFQRRAAACQPPFLLPAPDLAPGATVQFGLGGSGEIYRFAGLSPPERDGDWTDGAQAALAFHLPDGTPRDGLVLELAAAGFVPVGEPSRVTALVNGVEVARWQFGRSVETVRAALPAEAIRPDGNVVVELAVQDPRAPSHYARTSDSRLLGIQIASLRLVAQ